MIYDLRASLIGLSYFVSAILFIFGLKRLSSPTTARSGNQLAAIGMTIALAVTLLDRQIVSFTSIIVGTIVGAAIGIYFGRTVKMTAMPQMVALFNGMGGATAALVSLAEFLRLAAGTGGGSGGAGELASIVLGTAIGAISFSGSIVAFLKLQELMTDKPLRWPFQMQLNLLVAVGILGLGVLVVLGAGGTAALWGVLALALLVGATAVLPIGGADMPVVISLLNSFTGMAAALTGFVVDNQILIVAGALVGASGTLLTLLMSRAMNRPISNVLFGAFGGGAAVASANGRGPGGAPAVVKETSAEDLAVALAFARSVVIIPGYGLAVAQAQHVVRELADELEKRGVAVRFAIHPVAGRMPGHMSVVLAESNVSYDAQLELEDANSFLRSADIALVVGANDTVNPAARHDRSSPLFGMPIIDADAAANVIVLKRSMNPGFAGVDNELFYHPKTKMLFGDARKRLEEVLQSVKSMAMV
ncbi:MAG: NAD(P)(+) transhydrogenase (Re/Si-specific) subunit beta [Gemmatimonadetes bacterium]|nr:NAD(P)(+) transhydrogenase (Re/Si-specific) subunit beta [Gemmatimonadota bacterium]